MKYIYFMPSILQIHLSIYVLNKNTLQLYFWYTDLVYLSAKLEQLIMYLMHFNCAEVVQLKTYWSIFDCAKVELLQVYVRCTLNISHLLFKVHTILISSDIKTHFRLNIKKCLEWYVRKNGNRFELYVIIYYT